MSWLKGILGGVVGAEVLSLLKDYIDKKGGLENVVKDFENAGLTNKVRSWISTGPNLPTNSVEIEQALGLDKLVELARNAGIPVDKVKDMLAEYLPIAIDKAAPEGKLPPKEAA